MSKGPGSVERTITALFCAPGLEGTDRSFTVADLCCAVFDTTAPTRAHRVSVVRAARTALRRATAAWRREPWSAAGLAHWRATAMGDRSLVFHHRGRPVRVWAVAITASGLVWSEAEIVEITPIRVSVVYKGVRCPLRRPLHLFGSWWRGVRFVGERDGFIAEHLEGQWREQFAHLIPTDLMPLERARQLLGLPDHYDEDDVIAAFRKAAKRCHPDMGGTAEQFRALIEARDRLLAALGTSAPPPRAPDFTPRGYRTVYATASLGHTRCIGNRRPLLAG